MEELVPEWGLRRDKGHDPAHLWSSHCHRDVNIITINYLGAFNDCIDGWLVLKCECRRLDERRHEAELDSVLLHERILELISHFHSVTTHSHQPQTLHWVQRPCNVRSWNCICYREGPSSSKSHYFYQLVAWHSGRTSTFGWQTFPVLRSTCRLTTYVGKQSATGQPTQPLKVDKWAVSCNWMSASPYLWRHLVNAYGVADWSGGVHAVDQLSVNAGNEWPQFAQQHHWGSCQLTATSDIVKRGWLQLFAV